MIERVGRRVRLAFAFLLTVGLLASGLAAGVGLDRVAAQSATPAAEVAATISVVAETDTGRTIAHGRGETDVPAYPARIVVMDEPLADHLLALGITPVGMPTRSRELPAYLAAALEGVAPIGEYGTPDPEAILALQPDLILGFFWDEAYYGQVSKIAPTVHLENVWEHSRQHLRTTLLDLGLALGMEEEAAARVAAYDAKAADALVRLDQAVGDETVALVRLRADRDFYLIGAQSGYGDLLTGDLGLTPAPLAETMVMDSVSWESLPELGAEHLFVAVESEETLEALGDDPLWQTIPAVANTNVYPVAIDTWIFGGGIQAAELMIDDILAALAPDAVVLSTGGAPLAGSLTTRKEL